MRVILGIATLLLVVETGGACGGDGGSELGPSVLTTLEVTPATATLFSGPPGNTVTLAVVAKDQNGQTMSGVGSPTFSSDNGAIADVADDGTVTAAGAGTANITASLTADGVTETGTTTVTVRTAPASAGVTAPSLQFLPPTVDVSQGGSVTWTFGPIHHTVSFTTAGAPLDVPELENGSASRTFPTAGSYSYRCAFHSSMSGLVRVH